MAAERALNALIAEVGGDAPRIVLEPFASSRQRDGPRMSVVAEEDNA